MFLREKRAVSCVQTEDFMGWFGRAGSYHAQSIEMPKRKKMPYSSHEKRWVCFLW